MFSFNKLRDNFNNFLLLHQVPALKIDHLNNQRVLILSCILLPDTPLEGACKVAEKIRRAIEGCTFTGKMEDLRLTASFGLASLNHDANASFDSVYQETDRALYEAKANGRNRVELA